MILILVKYQELFILQNEKNMLNCSYILICVIVYGKARTTTRTQKKRSPYHDRYRMLQSLRWAYSQGWSRISPCPLYQCKYYRLYLWSGEFASPRMTSKVRFLLSERLLEASFQKYLVLFRKYRTDSKCWFSDHRRVRTYFRQWAWRIIQCSYATVEISNKTRPYIWYTRILLVTLTGGKKSVQSP